MILRVDGFKIYILEQEKIGIFETKSTKKVGSISYTVLPRRDDGSIYYIYVKGDKDGDIDTYLDCRNCEEVAFCLNHIRIWARINNIKEFKVINNGRIKLC